VIVQDPTREVHQTQGQVRLCLGPHPRPHLSHRGFPFAGQRVGPHAQTPPLVPSPSRPGSDLSGSRGRGEALLMVDLLEPLRRQ